MVATMRVGDESLRSVRRPFHRAANLTRGPKTDDLLRINENLRAEAAADVWRNNAQFVFGCHANEGGNHKSGDVWILRGVPQRQMIGTGVVFRERGARFDRIGRQTVVDDVELGDMLCDSEG